MTDASTAVTLAGDPSLDALYAGPSNAGLLRVRLDISYDGADFSGWAAQPERRTVQDELQQALARILRSAAPTLTVAGRTDAGVHALGQVAHFDIPASVWDVAQEKVLRKLAGVLPPDIRVSAARIVPFDFDARFSALWRRYIFRISDAAYGGDPLRRGFVLHWRRAVDVHAMQAAATHLLGEHDFVAFCKFRPEATSVRAMQTFTVIRETGGEIVCELRADAFCHSMVRSLVGALLCVGEGRRATDWPASLLTRTTRADDVPVVAPHGLALVEVGYPPDDELAARTAITRNRRVR